MSIPIVEIYQPVADGYQVPKSIKVLPIACFAVSPTGAKIVSMSITASGATTSYASSLFTYAWTVPKKPGNYTIVVTATDEFGNVGTKAVTVRK
jgi:hypothetical protein